MSGQGILLLFLISSVIILFMGLALVLFVMRYQKRMMQQREAIQQKEKEQQAIMLKAALDGQEKERHRIATDLHDSVGVQLSTIRLKLLMHGESHAQDASLTNEAAEMLAQSIQEVREISHNLQPGVLASYGLTAAIKELCLNVSGSTHLKMEFDTKGKESRLPIDRELAIYRIVQELTNNTLKHAKATRVHCQLIWSASQIVLIFEDNGIGFQLDGIDKGLGIYNIQSRVHLLNASVKFDTNSDKGMKAQLIIPIKEA